MQVLNKKGSDCGYACPDAILKKVSLSFKLRGSRDLMVTRYGCY